MIPPPRQESGPSPADPVPRDEHRPPLAFIAIVIVAFAAITFAGFALAPHFSRDRLEEWIRGAGAWGPLVLLGVQAAQILIAPIPGFFVPVLAGLMYGPVAGPLITMTGSVVGSAGAYWIGRWGGRPVAERLMGPGPIRKAHDLLGGKRWLALVPLLLFPFSPADALCFAAGIIGMDPRRFLIAVALGRLPKDALVAAGAALGWSFLRP